MEIHNIKERKWRGKKSLSAAKLTKLTKHTGKGTVETQSYQKTKDKMLVTIPPTSIVTLGVDGLNSPIRRHRTAGELKDNTQLHAAFGRRKLAAKTIRDSE